MTITCCIRYRIDPFQREAFSDYARAWLSIIPACGGEPYGYRLPHEGIDDGAGRGHALRDYRPRVVRVVRDDGTNARDQAPPGTRGHKE